VVPQLCGSLHINVPLKTDNPLLSKNLERLCHSHFFLRQNLEGLEGTFLSAPSQRRVVAERSSAPLMDVWSLLKWHTDDLDADPGMD